VDLARQRRHEASERFDEFLRDLPGSLQADGNLCIMQNSREYQQALKGVNKRSSQKAE
jgi:hypothetical protein